MFDADLCIQIFGKPFCDLSSNPVLTKRSLYENINRSNEKKQGKEKPFQYFFKSPQGQLFKL